MLTAPLPRAPRTLLLRRRLALLIALCAGLTALLSMLATGATGWWLQAGQAQEETTEVARTLAFALEAPLAFGDAAGTADALRLLRARPQVSGAWVVDADARAVAHYGGAEQPPPAAAQGFTAGFLLAAQDVVNDGRVVGRVVVVNQLSRWRQALAIAIAAIGLGSLVGFGVSVWLAQRIARAVTRPITTLAQASRHIANSHDYLLRLPEGERDEVGTAVRAFNGMLDEIQRRGDALVAANAALEARVEERTLALRAEKERAEAASVAKTRFLANMSHELRTPLNAVIGAAQLMQADGDTSDAHLLEAIHGSGMSLLGLIENVLDIARIETGALELACEDFNLLDCVEAAVATASVAARLKGLTMACIFSPALATWRHGDALRLRQVLLNLIGNAVKFTLAGEVVVRVEAGSEAAEVRISVSDSGIGIGAASLERIFEPFRQADDRSNRRFGGSGLGLAISRQLVQAMGGQLTVRSRLGQGSSFATQLPLPPAHAVPADTPPLARAVAVYEPHEASAEALLAQLARLGCDTLRCRSAAALRRWVECRPPGAERPWLLLAQDAAESATLRAEALPLLGADRIIGMHLNQPASPMGEDACLTRPLVKPVLRSALVSRLGDVRVVPAAALTALSHAPGVAPLTPAASARVLVVEDDKVNQTIVGAMLRNAGYQVSLAEGGAQALALMQAQSFDLVLMDWQMPDMDGLEVTRRLRTGAAGSQGRTLPIVALTANAFAEDRAACLAAGMNDFLTKPVLAAKLEATVARWTRAALHRDADARPVSACAPRVESQPEQALQAM